MNILFLSFIVPYPINRGDQRRIMVALSSLCLKHDVTLLCLSEDRPTERAIQTLEMMCKRVEIVPHSRLRKRFNQVTQFRSPPPLRVSACRSRPFSRRVQQCLASESFDLIYAFDARMAPYLPARSSSTTVLDFCDAYSIYYERAARVERNPLMKRILHREQRRMAAYEKRLVMQTDTCVICSDLDHAAVSGGSTGENVHVIPNTIDVDAYVHVDQPTYPHSMIYLGNMALKANRDAVLHFCRDILPLIHRRVPDAKLYVVGPGVSSEIRHLAQADAHVEVTGRIEDLTDFLSRCQVFVCPLRIGAGTRIKLLEAMAVGLPVVTTSLGCEGIEITPGRHMIVADDDGAFAEGVVQVLSDGGLREDLVGEAKAFVRTYHDIAIVAQQLDDLIGSLRSVPSP